MQTAIETITIFLLLPAGIAGLLVIFAQAFRKFASLRNKPAVKLVDCLLQDELGADLTGKQKPEKNGIGSSTGTEQGEQNQNEQKRKSNYEYNCK
jgi:hypothetical protein